LYGEHPEIEQRLTDVMEQIVTNGRSTPGAPQQNDVPVNWKRFIGTLAVSAKN
jgi:hypothetical protein